MATYASAAQPAVTLGGYNGAPSVWSSYTGRGSLYLSSQNLMAPQGATYPIVPIGDRVLVLKDSVLTALDPSPFYTTEQGQTLLFE